MECTHFALSVEAGWSVEREFHLCHPNTIEFSNLPRLTSDNEMQAKAILALQQPQSDPRGAPSHQYRHHASPHCSCAPRCGHPRGCNPVASAVHPSPRPTLSPPRSAVHQPRRRGARGHRRQRPRRLDLGRRSLWLSSLSLPAGAARAGCGDPTSRHRCQPVRDLSLIHI